MKKIVLGGLAALIGVVGLAQFFYSFLGVILGALPILLILGGGLAFYLGFTDIQESKKEDPHPAQDIQTETEPVDATPETPHDPAPETSTMDTSATRFKGNAETLVFHSIDCKFSQGKKCTTEFATREEAVEQGYKPCKVCAP